MADFVDYNGNIINDYAKKSEFGLGSSSDIISDILSVSISTDSGKIQSFDSYNGTVENLPISGLKAIGKRYILSSDSTCTVLLYEHYPYNGRMWKIDYINNGWRDWKLLCGSVTLWTGNVREGSTIDLLASLKYLNSIDVYVATTERPINIPVQFEGIGVSSSYGGMIFKDDGDLFYIYGIQVSWNDDGTRLKIEKCARKNINSGVYETSGIVRIIGRP